MRKYSFVSLLSIILAILSLIIGHGGYLSKFMVQTRGLCPTGGHGSFVTQGLYNCYTILDNYLIWMGYIIAVIAILIFAAGFKKKI